MPSEHSHLESGNEILGEMIGLHLCGTERRKEKSHVETEILI